MTDQVLQKLVNVVHTQVSASPIPSSLEAAVGNTPLLPLRRVTAGLPAGVQVLAKAPKGGLVVDRGGEKALLSGGKSLLPPGIREVKGHFSHGDSVVVVNEWSEELGVGMVNYDSGDIRKIMGLKTTEVEAVLGFRHDDEVIHRDNLVITRNLQEGEAVCL